MANERRDKLRILVGPEHTVRFMVKGHAFSNVRITNLSCGGCFATVADGDGGLFPMGMLLEHFGFEHPELPGGTFSAVITFTLGGRQHVQHMEFMGLGIRFIEPPAAVLEGLQALIEAHQ